jgi:dephospho-CoA kinase
MKIFIGLVGEKGSGKDTFAEILKKVVTDHSITRSRSSAILAETLDVWNLPKTRHNLQYMAIVMEEGFGRGTLTQALKKRILEVTEDIVVFDAVRWYTDIDLVRSFPKNLLVYITAPVGVRYERTKARNEKVDEAQATFDQFMKDELVATERDIPNIGAKADVKIENSGNLEQFEAAIREFYQQKVSPLLNRQ